MMTHDMDSTLRRPGFILRLAVALGIATGLGEVALFWAQRYILHRFIFVGRDLVWMAPLADLVIFLVLAGVVLLLLRLIPRLSGAAAAGIFFFVSALALLWMFTPLHHLAALVLALGVAVQLARMAGHHRAGFERLVRVGAPALVVLAITLGVGSAALRTWQERRALGALPAASAGRPNVLLIILDTVRAWNLSGYGYGRATTPALDQVIREGVRFDWAFSPAPWTLPSHASIFTGRFPHELQADWLSPMGTEHRTLAEAMAAQGYLTAGFVANTLYCDWEKGLHRGFQHYEDFPLTLSEIFRNAVLVRELSGRRWVREPLGSYEVLGRKSAAMVNHDFLDWLGSGKDRPFFAFLNYFDAHAPYLPPDSLLPRFTTPGLPLEYSGWIRYRGRPQGDSLPDDYVADNRDRYDASLAELDRQLGLLFRELKDRGVLDNTIVIITSDHGEQFGEHNLMGHGNSLYLPVMHVPLVIRYPDRVPADVQVSTPVGLRSLPATVADLAGLEPESFPSRSLARLWSADSAAWMPDTLVMEVEYNARLPRGTPVDQGTMRALVLDSLHYILNGDGREELYAFRRDSAEIHDLSGRPEWEPELRRHREPVAQLPPGNGERPQ